VSLLEIEGIHGGYAEADILRGISLRVEPGEIVTVAGTNGAGKSTLIKAVMGLVPRCRGRIDFDGQDLLRLAPEDRIVAGIGYVPQVANVFGALSVLDNLRVVEHVSNRAARIREMLERFPALDERRHVAARSLSGGERQQLAFARALMSRPKLLLLDEPTAALSPNLVEQVFDLIRALPSLSAAALLVEQRARQSLQISHRGYILDSGTVVLEGAAEMLLADTRMAQLYLGGVRDLPSGEASPGNC
jgi:ABC-type branched-subunit amino acid transport system ATPase component